MHLEVEQKFRIVDSQGLMERLAAVGPLSDARHNFERPVVQVDRYYAHPSRYFAQTDEALRIRRVGQENFVTYKGPKLDAATKTRREIELGIPPGDEGDRQFGELLLALGFREVAEVCKLRRRGVVSWHGRQVEIALDDVQGVGQFVELEIVTGEDELPAARACIQSLAEALHLSNGERRSYLELLLEGRKRP